MTFNIVISRPVENALPNLKMIPTMVPKFNFVENQNFDKQTDGWTGFLKHLAYNPQGHKNKLNFHEQLIINFSSSLTCVHINKFV